MKTGRSASPSLPSPLCTASWICPRATWASNSASPTSPLTLSAAGIISSSDHRNRTSKCFSARCIARSCSSCVESASRSSSGPMSVVLSTPMSGSGRLFAQVPQLGLVVLFGRGLGDERRRQTPFDGLLGDNALAHVPPRGQFELHVQEDLLHDRAQAARARFAL